jgi:membrane associated rhomboid family serine protease
LTGDPVERGAGRSEPLFNVPSSVVVLLATLVLVHAVRAVLPEDLDNWVVLAGAFIPSRLTGAAALLPGGEPAIATSFVTHMLLHGNLTHLMFNALWLLAFGGAVALRIGTARFLAFTLFTGLVAVLAFLASSWGETIPMIGASGAVAGLMGGTMRFLFSAMDDGGLWRLREVPRSVRLMPLGVALRDRRVLLSTAFLVGINLIASTGWGVPGESGGGIAWQAHLGGYFAGLLGFGLFDLKAPRRPDLRVVPTIH